jgi:pyruvate carboxylase
MIGNTEPEENFVRVFTSTAPLDIEAAKAILEEEDIPSYTINKRDSTYMFGEIELYVPAGAYLRAQVLLTTNDLL